MLNTAMLTTGMSPPDLVSVGTGTVGGGCDCFGCGPPQWEVNPTWTTTGADDVRYQVDIDMASDSGGTSFSSLVTGLTTASSSYNDNTGHQGNEVSGSNLTTYYRKYRIKIVRKSDSFVVEQMDTNQEQVTFSADACA